jgi:dTDP-4-amino-4,6-dideoxygalactose transaminase
MRDMSRIPVMRPRLPNVEDYYHYLLEIDASGVYSNRGPLVRDLEVRYSEKLGVDDPSLVVLCSNATLAIQGFLEISDIQTWHIPSFTFAATVHAAIHSGKMVVLEDIDPKSWMISPAVVNNPLEEGLVPVLPFGAPFDSSLYSHLDYVLIDAAASIGDAVTWLGCLRNNWGAVFSLHATKSFGIGEGGLVVFGSKEMADRFRTWINFGFNGTRESQISGTNAKLSEVQAAVGLSVLDNWRKEEEEWAIARSMVDKVSEELSIGPFEAIPKGSTSPYWIISHSEQEVISNIERGLARVGVETRSWWSHGCHQMPAFSKECYPSDHYEVTNIVGKRYLGLPFFRGISSEQIHTISDLAFECI